MLPKQEFPPETPLIAFAVAIVIVVSAVAYLNFTQASAQSSPVAQPTSTSSTLEDAASPCSETIPSDPLPNLGNESESNLSHLLDNGSVRSIAFVMQPGAATTLCISYGVQGNHTAEDYAVQAYSVSSTPLSGGYKYSSGGYEYAYTLATNINFSFDATSLNSTSTSLRNLIVVYSIMSSLNSTGFYTITYPNDCPPFTPLAITTSGSGSVSAADFPGFLIPSSCRINSPFGNVEITGFSGMSAAWLTG